MLCRPGQGTFFMRDRQLSMKHVFPVQSAMLSKGNAGSDTAWYSHRSRCCWKLERSGFKFRIVLLGIHGYRDQFALLFTHGLRFEYRLFFPIPSPVIYQNYRTQFVVLPIVGEGSEIDSYISKG